MKREDLIQGLTKEGTDPARYLGIGTPPVLTISKSLGEDRKKR